jgi:hypothetical protein
MKTKQLTHGMAAALVGAAFTLLISANVSEGSGHGGGHGGSGRGGFSAARIGGSQFSGRTGRAPTNMSQLRAGDNRGVARRRGLDDRAGHNANDNRGLRRGRGADDPANHDLNDDRGRNNQVGDDNNHRRRGRGLGK